MYINMDFPPTVRLSAWSMCTCLKGWICKLLVQDISFGGTLQLEVFNTLNNISFWPQLASTGWF